MRLAAARLKTLLVASARGSAFVMHRERRGGGRSLFRGLLGKARHHRARALAAKHLALPVPLKSCSVAIAFRHWCPLLQAGPASFIVTLAGHAEYRCPVSHIRRAHAARNRLSRVADRLARPLKTGDHGAHFTRIARGA